MKYIVERVYAITFSPARCTYERESMFIAESLEEAIEMCRDDNKDCFIKNARYVSEVKPKPTKTITVEI